MTLVILQTIFLSTFIVLTIVTFFFFISVFTGAPYVPTPTKKVKKMLEYANLKKDDKVIDLGSGDGRLLIATAKLGIKVRGVEINPGLWFYSLINISKHKLIGTATVTWGDLFRIDYSEYNVIFVAGFVDMMKKLEKDFEIKLKKGTRVVCYAFPLPHKKPVKSSEGVYLYQY